MIPIATNTNNNKYKKLVMILSDILKCTLTEGMNDKINNPRTIYGDRSVAIYF